MAYVASKWRIETISRQQRATLLAYRLLPVASCSAIEEERRRQKQSAK